MIQFAAVPYGRYCGNLGRRAVAGCDLHHITDDRGGLRLAAIYSKRPTPFVQLAAGGPADKVAAGSVHCTKLEQPARGGV